MADTELGPRARKRDTCECGAVKTVQAKRCKRCAMAITGARRRFLNHNCIDCGKTIAKGAQRCRPCFHAQHLGAKHQNWRGGRYIGQNGYVYLNPRHHEAGRFKGRHQVAEHTVVMEEVLGRPLRPNESVHHKNGIRHDNRPANLELWVKSQPAGQRAVDLLAWAREIIDRYAPEEPMLAEVP